MSDPQVQAILSRLDSLGEKMDLHIVKSDKRHEETTVILNEIKPILQDFAAAKRVSGWIGKFFNSKLGWVVLVAMAGWFGLRN